MTADVPDPRSTDPVLRDDRLLDAVGRGDPPPVDHPADDPVAHLLVGWHAELVTRARGLHRGSADPVLPDDELSDGAGDLPPFCRFSGDPISGAVAHRRDRPVGAAPGQRPRPAVPPAKPPAPRRWRLAALARATVAMVATAGGLWVSAAGAEPGSPLWPVTELLCAGWADSRLAEQEASNALDEARRAVAEGRYAAARHHLDRAAGLLTTAGCGANVPRLRVEADALRRSLPEPATSAATPPAASIEAKDPAPADAMSTEPPSATTASVEPQAPAPPAAEPTIAGNHSSGTATATSAKPATSTAIRSRGHRCTSRTGENRTGENRTSTSGTGSRSRSRAALAHTDRRVATAGAAPQRDSPPALRAPRPDGEERHRVAGVLLGEGGCTRRAVSARRAARTSLRRRVDWPPVSLTIGIVGLPNVGKSTLFNALTKNHVLAANYPFATIEPNVGVVGLPDERLHELAGIFDSQKLIPAPVSFVDIAGLVKGASKGQGRGNAFLANIRDASAICQVVRAFSDPNVVHVDGKVSPADDIETINTELILADLQTIEKALPRLEKETKLRKDRLPVLTSAKQAAELLNTGVTLYAGAKAAGIDVGELRELHLLTAKPFLYVFNVDEAELANAEFLEELRALVFPAEAVFMDAKVESELIELAEDEARELLESIGQPEPGLNQLIRVGFRTLGLQTYLTAGPKEARAWTIPVGATAPEAAGVIHSDFQRGFIKAEVVSYEDLLLAGSMAAAKAAGRVRIEGKEYVMQDGDVVEFRFNV